MTPNEPKSKPYTGPAKPVPTHRDAKELISDRAELVIFLLLAVFFVVLLLTGVI